MAPFNDCWSCQKNHKFKARSRDFAHRDREMHCHYLTSLDIENILWYSFIKASVFGDEFDGIRASCCIRFGNERVLELLLTFLCLPVTQ